MTNEQTARHLAKAAMILVKQYQNDKGHDFLQKQLVRKFLTILNNTNPETTTEPSQPKTAMAFGPSTEN